MTVRYVKSVILASVMYYAPLLRLLFCPSDCLSNALELRVNTRLFCRIYLHHLISYGSGSVVEKQRENICNRCSWGCYAEWPGYEKSRFSTNISLYLRNGASYRHNYNGIL